MVKSSVDLDRIIDDLWEDYQRLMKIGRNNSPLQVLKSIQLGDLIGVVWVDAATVKDADIRKIPLPNDYVETRRYTPGVYVCVQKGSTWHIETLVLLRDQTDDIRSEIRCIPIPLIMSVKFVAVKTSETMEKAVAVLKKISHIERRFVRLQNGAMKIFD